MNHGGELLRVEGLSVHFPLRGVLVRALDGLDLSMHMGRTLGLVGESGSGKSITARAIMRIIPEPGRITAGKILLASKSEAGPVDLVSLKSNGADMRAIRGCDMGMVFQEPMSSFSPVHTIGDQIAEPLRKHMGLSRRAARERCVEMLNLVGIPKAAERVDAYSFQLSGGMRQRAMIAMALVTQPRLLLADEPTTALDVTIQAQILELLAKLQDEFEMSTLLITHNLGVVARVAHDVTVIYLGRVMEHAPVEQLFRHPRHPYTWGLLGAIPALGRGLQQRKRLMPIPGVVPGPHQTVHGCPFHPRCSSMTPGQCDRYLPAMHRVNDQEYVRCFLYTDGIEGDEASVSEATASSPAQGRAQDL